MERKSSGKVSRILLTLLVCAFAAFPADAIMKCSGGFHRYALGPGFYAPNLNAALTNAEVFCRQYWPTNASYSAANAYKSVYPTGENTYNYECWKCSDVPLPGKLPLGTALDIAFDVRPGMIINASTGEIDIDEDTARWVYSIDIQQADGIVRVCVDAMTGEVVAASPADAGDQ